MAEIIRKTTGAISTIVGSLMIFHAVADSYQGRLAVITNLVNLCLLYTSDAADE